MPQTSSSASIIWEEEDELHVDRVVPLGPGGIQSEISLGGLSTDAAEIADIADVADGSCPDSGWLESSPHLERSMDLVHAL